LHVMYISLFYFYTVKGCGIKSMRYLQWMTTKIVKKIFLHVWNKISMNQECAASIKLMTLLDSFCFFLW
jgi:hypothetical protein